MKTTEKLIESLLFDLGKNTEREADGGPLFFERQFQDVSFKVGFVLQMDGNMLNIIVQPRIQKCQPLPEERVGELLTLINFLNSSTVTGRWFYDDDFMPRYDMQIPCDGAAITHRQLASALTVVDEMVRSHVVCLQLWCKSGVGISPQYITLSTEVIAALIKAPEKAQQIYEALSPSDELTEQFAKLATTLGADFDIPNPTTETDQMPEATEQPVSASLH